MDLLRSFLRKDGGMSFFTFPHLTAWNLDMIAGVSSAILGHEDDGHTLGSELLQKSQAWPKNPKGFWFSTPKAIPMSLNSHPQEEGFWNGAVSRRVNLPNDPFRNSQVGQCTREMITEKRIWDMQLGWPRSHSTAKVFLLFMYMIQVDWQPSCIVSILFCISKWEVLFSSSCFPSIIRHWLFWIWSNVQFTYRCETMGSYIKTCSRWLEVTEGSWA